MDNRIYISFINRINPQFLKTLSFFLMQVVKTLFLSIVLQFLFYNTSCLFAQTSYDKESWQRNAMPGNEIYVPVTLANGVYGITFSQNAFTGNAIKLNDVFDNAPMQGGSVESSVSAVDFTHLELISMSPGALNSEKADFLKGKSLEETPIDKLKNWQQTFDFRQGWLKTNFGFEGLEIEHKGYALKHMLQTGMVKVTITATEDKCFSIKNRLTAGIRNQFKSSKYLFQLRDRQIPLFTVSAYTPEKKQTIATTSSIFFEGEKKPTITYHDDGEENPYIYFEECLKKGESISFYVIGSMASSQRYSNPVNETARLNIYTYLAGPEKVLNQHKTAWEEYWQNTDIVIEGAPEYNRDIRQMMFMLNSFVNENTNFSTACMGLGQDFWGYKTLWDADFWMYPAILLINPKAAKSMLEYRYKRLEMAKHNAAAHGYKGAMFPWESGSTGEEQTSLMYLTGPFQHHVSSDVAMTFWYYYYVTQDKEHLVEKGYPVMKAVAEFWVSRVEKETDGSYVIKNVVGSDEHAINIDNDAFTNGSTIALLRAVIDAAEIVGEEPDPIWKEIADKMVIRSFPNGITKEHDSYSGETIKQADVNLNSFPLDIIDDKQLIKRNLLYYEKRMDIEGPNMSYPVFAGAAARTGDVALTTRLFKKAIDPYKKGDFKILSLRIQRSTTFFGTGAGGLMQAVILGFGGLHFTKDGLLQKEPLLPEGWKSLTLKGIGNCQTYTVK